MIKSLVKIANLKAAFIIFKQNITQLVKLNLNKKLDPEQKIIQAFNIGAKGFRRTRNEDPLTWEIGATS